MNRKYQGEGALARYQDIYGLVKQITSTEADDPQSAKLNPSVKENSSEFELLMDCLNKARQKGSSMYFSYQLRGSDHRGDAEELENGYLHFARGQRQHVNLTDVTGLFF